MTKEARTNSNSGFDHSDIPSSFELESFAPGSLVRLPIPQHLGRGVLAAGADHAAAGVGRTAAEIQSCERRAVIAVAGHRAEVEELVQRHGSLEDVAAGE